MCFDGIVNDRSCPLGKHFSYYESACVDPFFADCILDSTLCAEAEKTGIPQFFANSRDCRSYFLCVGEISVPLRCAPGQHYDPEFYWCDSPETAECTPAIPPDAPIIPDDVSKIHYIFIDATIIIIKIVSGVYRRLHWKRKWCFNSSPTVVRILLCMCDRPWVSTR